MQWVCCLFLPLEFRIEALKLKNCEFSFHQTNNHCTQNAGKIYVF